MIFVLSISHSSAIDGDSYLALIRPISTNLGAATLGRREYCLDCFAHRYACSLRALSSAASDSTWMICNARIVRSTRTKSVCMNRKRNDTFLVPHTNHQTTPNTKPHISTFLYNCKLLANTVPSFTAVPLGYQSRPPDHPRILPALEPASRRPPCRYSILFSRSLGHQKRCRNK